MPVSLVILYPLQYGGSILIMERDHLFSESDAKGWYRKELTLVE